MKLTIFSLLFVLSNTVAQAKYDTISQNIRILDSVVIERGSYFLFFAQRNSVQPSNQHYSFVGKDIKKRKATFENCQKELLPLVDPIDVKDLTFDCFRESYEKYYSLHDESIMFNNLYSSRKRFNILNRKWHSYKIKLLKSVKLYLISIPITECSQNHSFYSRPSVRVENGCYLFYVFGRVNA